MTIIGKVKTKWQQEDVDAQLQLLDELGCKFISVGEERGFSWRSCGLCQRDLGGSRYAIAMVIDDEVCDDDEICVDCACYIANGDVPCDDD